MNKTQVFDTLDDFLNREDKKINGVSKTFAENNPEYKKQNSTNVGCSYCSDCSYCSKIDNIHTKVFKDNGDDPEYTDLMTNTKIDNIHTKVFEAASATAALDMSTWHRCNTKHCRAGWVTTLAGENGKKLEELTSCAFAAKIIYRNSSNIHVPIIRFFDNDEAAMKDMRRCADLEAQAAQRGY